MPLLVLLWLASAFASEPAQPVEPVPAAPSATSQPSTETPPEPEAVSFTSQLNEAKRAYFEGRVTDALRLFQDLEARLKVRGEQPSWEEAAEAMTYLGEIHLAQNHPDFAEEAFRWVLERDPDTPMRSPYRHPMEVVTLFEDVRAKVERERREDVPPPPPTLVERDFPEVALLPLGIPQFSQRRPFVGVLAAGTQLGLGIASYVTWRDTRAFNRAGAPNESAAAVAEFQNQVQAKRAVQLSLGAATYVSWGLWSLEAGVAAGKARRRAMLSLGASPEGAPVLALHGRL